MPHIHSELHFAESAHKQVLNLGTPYIPSHARARPCHCVAQGRTSVQRRSCCGATMAPRARKVVIWTWMLVLVLLGSCSGVPPGRRPPNPRNLTVYHVVDQRFQQPIGSPEREWPIDMNMCDSCPVPMKPKSVHGNWLASLSVSHHNAGRFGR